MNTLLSVVSLCACVALASAYGRSGSVNWNAFRHYSKPRPIPLSQPPLMPIPQIIEPPISVKPEPFQHPVGQSPLSQHFGYQKGAFNGEWNQGKPRPYHPNMSPVSGYNKWGQGLPINNMKYGQWGHGSPLPIPKMYPLSGYGAWAKGMPRPVAEMSKFSGFAGGYGAGFGSPFLEDPFCDWNEFGFDHSPFHHNQFQKQFPLGPNQFPAGPNQFPAGPNQFLAGLNQFPVGPNQFLAGPNQFPAGPNQFPAGPNQFPAGPNQFPMGPDQFAPDQFGVNTFLNGPNQFPAGSDNFGPNQIGPNPFPDQQIKFPAGPDQFSTKTKGNNFDGTLKSN